MSRSRWPRPCCDPRCAPGLGHRHRHRPRLDAAQPALQRPAAHLSAGLAARSAPLAKGAGRDDVAPTALVAGPARHRYLLEEDSACTPEPDDIWCLRVCLELQAAGLYDTDTGTWIDASLAGLNGNDPDTAARVDRWLAGAPDSLLDRLDLCDTSIGPANRTGRCTPRSTNCPRCRSSRGC